MTLQEVICESKQSNGGPAGDSPSLSGNPDPDNSTSLADLNICLHISGVPSSNNITYPGMENKAIFSYLCGGNLCVTPQSLPQILRFRQLIHFSFIPPHLQNSIFLNAKTAKYTLLCSFQQWRIVETTKLLTAPPGRIE